MYYVIRTIEFRICVLCVAREQGPSFNARTTSLPRPSATTTTTTSVTTSITTPYPLMLVLSSFNKLLSHVLAPPTLHTAVIFSPSGELIAFESSRARPKDDVRVLVGVASDIWAETRDDGEGMVESEVSSLLFSHFLSLQTCFCSVF